MYFVGGCKYNENNIFGFALHNSCAVAQEFARACPRGRASLRDITAGFESKTQHAHACRFCAPHHFVLRVARLGFEPRYTPPEGAVLPLDDLAIDLKNTRKLAFVQCAENVSQRIPYLCDEIDTIVNFAYIEYRQ